MLILANKLLRVMNVCLNFDSAEVSICFFLSGVQTNRYSNKSYHLLLFSSRISRHIEHALFLLFLKNIIQRSFHLTWITETNACVWPLTLIGITKETLIVEKCIWVETFAGRLIFPGGITNSGASGSLLTRINGLSHTRLK